MLQRRKLCQFSWLEIGGGGLSREFNRQVFLQGVGDSVVQSQGRQNSGYFCSLIDVILFGTSHTCSCEDHLETTRQMTHILIQDIGTRWLNQKNTRWMMIKIMWDTLNFLKAPERDPAVWQNTKAERTRRIWYIPVNVTHLHHTYKSWGISVNAHLSTLLRIISGLCFFQAPGPSTIPTM